MYFLPGIGSPPAVVRRGRMSTGDRGVGETLAKMRRLVAFGASNLRVRETAVGIVRGGPAHDAMSDLRALFDWVRSNIRFTPDVLGVETLQSPEYTLGLRAGDCDDMATLLGALARSIGIPVELKFRVIAANPRAPRSFSHVYLVASVNGRQVALDPTYSNNSIGWEFPNPSRTSEVTV